MASDLNILVVDDTVTYRQILSKLVSEIEGVSLVGAVSNGKIALSRIKVTNVDLVLLDMFMPVLDGLETLKIIKRDYPHIEVIMISAFEKGNAKLTMLALENDALDFIPKPRGEDSEENFQKLRSTLLPLMSLVKTRKYSRKAIDYTDSKVNNLKRTSVIAKPKIMRSDINLNMGENTNGLCEKQGTKPAFIKKQNMPIRVVALGVSTGGPNALLKVIPLLSEDFPVPILCVQHMPPMFTSSLAERLNKLSKITVLEGKHGDDLKKGHMYIAPGGRHMVARKIASKYVLGIVDSPPVNSCKPAVDVLLRSVINVYGGSVLTVIMTGMGNDGAAGVSAIRRNGGYSIVQDKESSVVWGMPGAVAKAKNADEIVDLEKIAERIEQIVKIRGSKNAKRN